MTIIKRGNSYWIDIGFNRTRYRLRSPDNSCKGAKVYETFLRSRLARGEPIFKVIKQESKKYAFKEFALQWLDVYVKNNNKPSEYYNKSNILKDTLIPYFGNKCIDAITAYDIEQYKSYLLQQRKLKPKSVNNYLSILSKCLKSAVESETLNDIPKIRLLKVPPQKYDFLTESETEKLLINAKGIWYEMILIAVRTGLRFGELIALKWEDFDFNSKTITVRRNIVHSIEGSPKNNRTRVIPLTNNVFEMLVSKKHDKSYIFCFGNGKPLYYTYCRRHLHMACKRAGIKIVNWHVLRHTFASQLVAKGVSIISIKELLGHSDLKMTMRYSHINLPILKIAIEALEPEIEINDTKTAQPHVRDSEFGLRLPINFHNSLVKSKEINEYDSN